MFQQKRPAGLNRLKRSVGVGRAIEAMEPRTLMSSVAPAVLGLDRLPIHRMAVVHHHAPKPVIKKHVAPVKKHGVAVKVVAAPVAHPGVIQLAGPFASPAVTNLSVNNPGLPPFQPAELRHFYGVDTISFAGITGDGRGQTVAIVDAYAQPNLLATNDPNYTGTISDLYQFDQQFNLPDPPSFIKINQNGGSVLPAGYNANWALETSLDVEWVHAMAPAANIVLVEANSANDDDLFQYAVNTARNYAGVSVVSMSFGESEFYGETADDSYFTTPAAHAGVTFVASVGDTGAGGTSYPSFSPNVVAVGGTQITTADTNSNYGNEVTWNDQYGATGGGISTIEPKPSYQAGVTKNATYRTVPDVSLNAAVSTGVYVRDTSQSGGGGYYQVGGTSLSAPAWGALIAIANQGRAQLGLGSMDGPSQTLPRLYQLASTDYHDILTGQNGFNSLPSYSAGPGYDLTTGLGTPIAAQLIPDLAGGATLSGRLFQDNNADAIYNGNDQALAGKTVYLDLHNLGYQISTDPTAVTDASGLFNFTDVIGTTGMVRLATIPTGYVQVGVSPLASSFGSTSSDTLAFFPTAFNDSTSNDTYTLQTSPTLPSQTQILVAGVLTYYAPLTLAPSFSFNFTGTNDKLVVDAGNGNPVPAGGVSFNGGSLAKGNTLSILGSVGDDTIMVNANAIVFGPNPITFANAASLVIDPRQGNDTLTINADVVNFPAQTAHAGILVRQFASLTVAAGASAVVPDIGLHSDRTLIVAGNLSINATAKLDLGSDDLLLRNPNATTGNALVAALASGFVDGAWTGNGIASSAAHADSQYLTTLGCLVNDNGQGSPYYNAFDGVPAFDGDILVKYTYYGDADLNGHVDGNDYSQIDFGYALGQTGWVNGDFNYDNKIDGSDYTLIDNAFNLQGNSL